MPDHSPPRPAPARLEVTFETGGPPEISDRMNAWLDRLEQQAAGRLAPRREQAGTRMAPPSLTLPGFGRSEISYHFIPEDAEAELFHELLEQEMGAGPGQRSGDKQPLHAGKEDPLEILLFVANQCPNCPRAVRTLHSLALDPTIPCLHVHLFEASVSQDLAARHRVRSVPTLLALPDSFRFVGTPDPERIARLLRAGSAEAFLQELIRHQVREGEAPEAGARIARMGDPTFLVEDLAASTFQERIGWMLALEQALEERPDSLDPLVVPLASLLRTAETSLRGDLADILGSVGRPEALPALERLLTDENPDVAEAAGDAIEAIRERIGS